MSGQPRGTGEYARLLGENARYTAAFDRSKLTAAPLSGLAVVACMDARLDIEEALGLRTGDAHLIRNAGGIVTDDVIRSLIVSQQLLGTSEIVVIEHTGCGLYRADEAQLRQRMAAMAGTHPDSIELELGSFADLEDNLRAQVERLRTNPYLAKVPVHGLIYDVATGRLTEIS